MVRITIAWELGGNSGHLARCIPIAEALRGQGHHVDFVACDWRGSSELLNARGFSACQAPIARRAHCYARLPCNYAEILLGEGYDDPFGLSARVSDWSLLFAQQRADVVLADHAPTALLAAQVHGRAHLAIGNGFSIPPNVGPLPNFRPTAEERVASPACAGEIVDTTINRVARGFGFRGESGLRCLFGKQDLLDTFPELDHYGARSQASYIGPIVSVTGTQAATWREGQGRKILVYLRPDIPGFPALMDSLRDQDAEVFCVIPGLDPARAEHLASPRMRIVLEPIDLRGLIDATPIVVSYGGSGMVALALLAGCPLLLVPRYMEQYMGARRVEELGAGVVLRSKRNKAAFAEGLAQLADDSRYALSARRFARKYAGFSPQAAIARAVAAIEACGNGVPVVQTASLDY